MDTEQYQIIVKLVHEGKHDDVVQFIKLAISERIKVDLSETKEDFANFSEEEFQLKTALSSLSDKPDQENLFEYLLNLDFDEKSNISKKKEELIWSFYNRFFPIRIAIDCLAGMIREREEKWIELEEFQEAATEDAQRICKRIKEYEYDKKLLRNQKISTGLPLHPIETKNIKRITERRKIEDRIDNGKRRFKKQIIGNHTKKTVNGQISHHFEGGCFSMGLISVKVSNDQCYVTLSKLGLDLVKMKNPILHEKDFRQVFSQDEVNLIFHKIISEFPLEENITNIVMDLINQIPVVNYEKIHEIFMEHKEQIFKFYSKNPEHLNTDQKKRILDQARASTMGRLAELKIINWNINPKGKSEYSLGDVIKVVRS